MSPHSYNLIFLNFSFQSLFLFHYFWNSFLVSLQITTSLSRIIVNVNFYLVLFVSLFKSRAKNSQSRPLIKSQLQFKATCHFYRTLIINHTPLSPFFMRSIFSLYLRSNNRMPLQLQTNLSRSERDCVGEVALIP